MNSAARVSVSRWTVWVSGLLWSTCLSYCSPSAFQKMSCKHVTGNARSTSFLHSTSVGAGVVVWECTGSLGGGGGGGIMKRAPWGIARALVQKGPRMMQARRQPAPGVVAGGGQAVAAAGCPPL